MDLVSFLEATKNKMQDVVLKLDEAKRGLPPEDRLEASRVQVAMMLGISIALMESFAAPGPEREHIVRAANEWSKRIQFVNIAGEVQKAEHPRLIVPSSRIVTPS